MVFCGKPSKACAPCRARKTKCDQSIPSCSQCLRAGRKCMGYRDEQSMVFRDETKKVVRKANAAKTQNKIPSSAARSLEEGAKLSEFSAVAADGELDMTTQENNQLAVRNPPISLDEQSACFFFNNFCHSSLASSKVHGRLYFLPRVYSQLSPRNTLAQIISSIGMAAMASTFKCPEMMFAAREKHTSVLRATNVALQDPHEAKTDSTLVTVLLLGIFEIVTGGSLKSLDSWTSHVVGATAIAQMRGRKQLQNQTGRSIFNLLRSHILVGCLQRDVAVPQIIIDWSGISSEYELLEELHERRLSLIMARVCALRSDFKNRKNDSLDLINRGHAIDADFEDWVNRLPCEFAYMTRKSSETDDGFLDYFHVYTDTRALTILNLYRCARILTHEVIMEYSDSHSMTSVSPKAQRRKSEIMIAQLSDEIAATVPFCLKGDPLEESSSHTANAVMGIALLWPLFVIARASPRSSGTRTWVIRQLDKIGRMTGVQQNTTVAKLMREENL